MGGGGKGGGGSSEYDYLRQAPIPMPPPEAQDPMAMLGPIMAQMTGMMNQSQSLEGI